MPEIITITTADPDTENPNDAAELEEVRKCPIFPKIMKSELCLTITGATIGILFGVILLNLFFQNEIETN